ncbi:Aste57867_9690 [Aphanomyces stellatus]|uniref:Aste57867_9690 protein n=1 Tax=Aphanomyces stellatus TaxID=120398 RepID=A0A485KNT3_9STRA|nr:hypothetical protein As57867_009652 [Aphanomyces stellatus]VFT86569.1 Aste57867_9690 [Aphanomyces stellatus]
MADDAKVFRVLTVGDGDLSYSRSLLERSNWKDLDVSDPSASVHLTATTYDSFAALSEKYAMAASNIDALKAATTLPHLTVHVQHEVDATNLAPLFGSSAADLHFDRIVFHHPHSGVEDVHRHRRLLSHFFHAALAVLKPHGRILVTLARDQPERWEILKRAAAANLVCTEQVVWTAPKGYTRKRHQSDKSFHQVLLHGEKLQQESTLFGFGRVGDGGKDDSTASSTTATMTAPSAPVPVSLGNPAWEFACDLCGGKRFATAQGKKTHMHMVHELNVKKRKRDGAALACADCGGRVFADDEALKQHRLAKHGKDSKIHPDWFHNQTTATAPPVATPDSYSCAICDEAFPTQSALDGHWTTLQPIQTEKVPCPTCPKTFEDLRALRQHQNFCQATVKATPQLRKEQKTT